VSSEFDRIVMKAIAPDPAARYQNAAQLHADLEAMAAPKKRHTGLWIAAAVVALALVAAGVWFLTTQQNAVVPGVVGVASADASATLVRAGFTMVVSGSRASSAVASDAVLSESPGAGKTVRKGSQIAVVLSTGKPMATVPGLAGLTLQAASAKIAAAGLVVGSVTSQASSVFPASSVLTQVPSAGTETTLGAAVDLIVSSGARQVTVLDVRSTSQTTAVARLTGQGLLVDVGESFSSQPVGIVVSQAPTPGSNVPAGSTVTISVSKGPAPVTVPDVKGAAAADAKTSLEEIGLVPVTVAASGTAAQKGTVIDQDPEPGTQVSAGSKVTIMVGK
jgi:serine/threonine-protein kinase